MNIDLVYLLGKTSNWQDNEIRYSLRSVEKYLTEYRNVIIVGYKPKFISENVTEIPHQDLFTNKSRNLMAKIYRACNDTRITKNFMVMNDDYFFLQPTSAVNYPFYYSGDLQQSSSRQWNNYRRYVEATLKILKAGRMPIKNFDIHKPIIYDKFKFKKMAEAYNWNVPYGYIVKSMYCNHWNLPGEQLKDHKINYPYKLSTIIQMNANQPMFSIGNKALNPDMKKYLNNLFPNPSKFEI